MKPEQPAMKRRKFFTWVAGATFGSLTLGSLLPRFAFSKSKTAAEQSPKVGVTINPLAVPRKQGKKS